MRPWLAAPATILAFTAAPLLAATANLSGGWAGPHAAVIFQGGLADVQFDCASGTIDVPVYPAKDGSFSARGTYRAGTPGPVRVGQIFRSEPANYSGTLSKDAITVTVTLEDGTALGPFRLARGAAPQLTRCL